MCFGPFHGHLPEAPSFLRALPPFTPPPNCLLSSPFPTTTHTFRNTLFVHICTHHPYTVAETPMRLFLPSLPSHTQDPKYPWDNLFMGDDRLQLRSDTDEQLVLHLVFSESVKVHSINLVAPEPGTRDGREGMMDGVLMRRLFVL